jgi:hypothetical protein
MRTGLTTARVTSTGILHRLIRADSRFHPLGALRKSESIRRTAARPTGTLLLAGK